MSCLYGGGGHRSLAGGQLSAETVVGAAVPIPALMLVERIGQHREGGVVAVLVA